MRWTYLLFVALTTGSDARGADVTRLPTGPVEALRARVQQILRGEPRVSLSQARRGPLGRVRVGLIVLEEATKALVDSADPFAADRITRVLRYAKHALHDVHLDARETDIVDGYLTIILRLLHHPRPADAVRMLYAHDAWMPHHLDYLITQVGSWPGRPHTYRALRAMRTHLNDEQLVELRLRLRAVDRRTDALAMLEEFGGLAPRRYAHLIHRLAIELSAGARNDAPYRGRTIEILLRAIDRVQRRWLAGDPVVRRAVRAAAAFEQPAAAREVIARLRRGQLDVDLRDQNLISSDPLGVNPRSAANVLDFAACARRLAR